MTDFDLRTIPAERDFSREQVVGIATTLGSIALDIARSAADNTMDAAARFGRSSGKWIREKVLHDDRHPVWKMPLPSLLHAGGLNIEQVGVDDEGRRSNNVITAQHVALIGDVSFEPGHQPPSGEEI